MAKKLSTHAQAAKEIRAILKESFPRVKFSVRSESYSGGSSIDINYTDGPTTEKVYGLVKDYKQGHFDGMRDLYVYSKNQKELPRVKHIFANRTISRGVRASVIHYLKEHWGFDITDQEKCFDRFRMWPDQLIYQETCKWDY